MFSPKYTITDKLLSQVKRINKLIFELNQDRFPNVVLFEYEKTARTISTHASTSIEGNPLPLTEVKKILKHKPEFIRDSEKEILNYNQALIDLDKKIKQESELSKKLILDIHKNITRGLLPKQDVGIFRKHPVVVNDPKTGRVAFLPPNMKDVQPLLSDLLSFIEKNNNRIDSVILAGIFHKQILIIHPFMDGNGRTTRLATKVLLAQLGLNTFNLFSFENYYNQTISRYFQCVGEFGDYYERADSIDFTDWLEYFAEGIIDELLRVKKILPKININPKTKLEFHHKKIITFINENSFITDKDYAKIIDRAKATRALDFRRLIDLRIIERKGGGRSIYYVLRE